MITNRSVPVNTLLPHVTYRDVAAAAAWLSAAFGFQEHYRYGEPDGIQMHLGSVYIMLNRERDDRSSPAHAGRSTQSLTLFVDDVEAHFEQAKSAGARIVEEPHETIYGEYQFAALDPEGHHWLFSRHAKDIAPEDWGAKVTGS